MITEKLNPDHFGRITTNGVVHVVVPGNVFSGYVRCLNAFPTLLADLEDALARAGDDKSTGIYRRVEAALRKATGA